MCNLQDKAGILSSLILLESQSTVDVFQDDDEHERRKEALGTKLLC